MSSETPMPSTNPGELRVIREGTYQGVSSQGADHDAATTPAEASALKDGEFIHGPEGGGKMTVAESLELQEAHKVAGGESRGEGKAMIAEALDSPLRLVMKTPVVPRVERRKAARAERRNAARGE